MPDTDHLAQPARRCPRPRTNINESETVPMLLILDICNLRAYALCVGQGTDGQV